ncbi:MAG: hypothetical protein PHQ04_10245 [Opitutaceae bacterium]|nr:hypothetical protein [Opitutaceae bacterium]
MSLNRCEQMLFDYWARQPEEKRHWEAKVRDLTHGGQDSLAVSRLIEKELWDYFKERSGQVEPFRRCASQFGLTRVSLQNLAEYLVRLWGPPPKPKQKPLR